MPRITALSSRCLAHAGKTFMIDELPVVTPMKYMVRSVALV
jgi:hypothetical protein